MRRPLYRPTYLLTANGLADAEEDARAAATQAAMAQSASGQGGTALDAEMKRMKRAVIESVAKTIAAQLAVTIAIYVGLQSVPVIGQIISAVMALIGLVTAPYVKAQTKEIVDNVKGELLRYAQATMTNVTEHAYAVTDDEFTAAQQLALSNVALNGWFDEGFTDIVRSIAKPIAKPFAKAHTVPVKLVGKGILKGGAAVARATGNQEVEYKFNAQNRKWEEKTDWADKQSTTMAEDPVMAIRVLHTAPFKTLSGLQQLDVIRDKARELLIKGKADLDAFRSSSIAVFDSQDYHDRVRVALAKAIRANPILQSQAAAAVQATGNGATAPAPSAASAGGMLSFAAIIGYFLLHK